MNRMNDLPGSQRLQEAYARLTDDELQALADDGYEHTDLSQAGFAVGNSRAGSAHSTEGSAHAGAGASL
jgi:hypothetical protein